MNDLVPYRDKVEILCITQPGPATCIADATFGTLSGKYV